jgi:hypothetical protein
VLALVLAVVGCAPTHVQTQQAAGMGGLPPPTGVVVEDFAVSPEQVRLDQGVSARVQRMSGDVPLSQTQAQVAEEARVTLAQALRAKLASYGLPAMAMPAGSAIPDRTLLVQGQIVAIDEGNRTRRVLIGLGAGRSSVSADAQLYYIQSTLVGRVLCSPSQRMPPAAVGREWQFRWVQGPRLDTSQLRRRSAVRRRALGKCDGRA